MKTVRVDDIEHLKNSYGFYDPRVKDLGLPVRTFWSSSDVHWINIDDLEETLYLVSKTTASRIREPITIRDPICGFTKVKNGYTPLYSRPNAINKISREFIYIIPKDNDTEGLSKDEFITLLRLVCFEKTNCEESIEKYKKDQELAFEFNELEDYNDCFRSMQERLEILKSLENKLVKFGNSEYYQDKK